MSKKQAPRSTVWINEAGLDKIRESMAKLQKPDNDNKRGKNCWTVEYLAQQAYVSSSTVKRLLNKKVPIDQNSAISILDKLGFDPLSFIAEHDQKLDPYNQNKPLSFEVDWRKICLEMLQEQQEEQHIRRKATEMGFEIKVYVPLGLLERKQQQRRSGIIDREQIHQLDQEVVTRIYEHQEFLDDIIGQQATDHNQHIAIIGEPGAGKTTLLDRIATYIKDKTQNLLICISLANLQGRPLKTYILKEWLPQAIALSYPELDPEALEKTFQHRLNQGGVWLLLDGADEGKLSLPEIQTELTNFVNIRVVLTCRTNVWDTYINNPLSGFKTYKTQDFKPEQIDKFIQDWFEQAKDEPRGKELQVKLKEPQRDRIRQLVTNPLRLALLCQIFYKDKNAELPETKAGLYEQFVRYFYEWKPAIAGIDWGTQPQLQNELHQALGKLAIAGLDSDYRYRLPLSLITTKMDDELFKLSFALGWLTLVDREESTGEAVYAFYHPTLQEYFAALAIEDWSKEFLNHVPHDPKLGVYRIFESQWKPVILFWLGKEEILISKKEILISKKEGFIKSLIQFNDQFKTDFFDGFTFYNYKAYFLALQAIIEFNSCYTNLIVNQVFHWAFGYFSPSEQNQEKDVFIEIKRAAQQSLLTTHQLIVIKKLLGFLNNTDVRTRIQSAETLGKIVPNHPKAIESLLNIINSSIVPGYRMDAAIALSNICNDKKQKIEYMEELCNHSCPLVRSIASQTIGKIEPQHPKAEVLIIKIEESPVVKYLNSVEEVEYWLNSLRLSKDKSEQQCAIQKLGNIINNVPEEMYSIIKDVIYELASIINSTSLEDEILAESCLSLFKLSKSNPKIFISGLSSFIQDNYLINNNYLYQKQMYYRLLWHCSESLQYQDFYTAWYNQLNMQLNESYDLGKLLNQLQRTDQVYPILIDGKYSLENLTDESAIAQELCNQLYETIFPNEKIPIVNNPPQLKRLFPEFKTQLNTPSLALVIYNIEPYPQLINVCHQLLGKFHIAFVTDEQIEPPLSGFPLQDNLAEVLQNWLAEISYGKF